MSSEVVEQISKVMAVLPAAGAVLLLLSPLRRWPRGTVTLWAVIAALGMLHLHLWWRYGAGITALSLALVAETNRDEALPLLASIPRTLWAAWGVIGLLWLLAMGRPPRLPHWPGRIIGFVGLLMLLLMFGFLHLIVATQEEQALASIAAGAQDTRYQPGSLSPPLNEWQVAVRRSFPVNLPLAVYDFWRDRRALHAALEARQSLRFGAVALPQPAPRTRRIQLLVVGETARADHWGLNGYPRDTTPQLSARDDVVSFRRFHSPLTYTRLSVPVILSRRPPDYPQAVFPERSLIAAANEAGWRTAWVSNQAALGFHDSPVALLANDAQTVIHASPVDYRAAGDHDRILLPIIDRLLAEDDPRDLLLVIHTMGSHYRYTDRYGEQDAYFQPDRLPDGTAARLFDASHRPYLVNSYDNSVRATDAFLAALIQRLHNTASPAWLFYVSDHGEALFDDCKQESGHGHSSLATHSVAAVWWASPAWRQRHPAQVNALVENQNTLLSTSMVFETVLSLSGIALPDPRPGRDFSRADVHVPEDILALNLDVVRCPLPDQTHRLR